MRSAPLGYSALFAAAVAVWLLTQHLPGAAIALSSTVLLGVAFYALFKSLERQPIAGPQRRRISSASSLPTSPARPSSSQPAANNPAPVNFHPPPPLPPPLANSGASRLVGGRYRLLRLLGEGGMKRVYIAEDLNLNTRQCAVAELIDTTADPAQQQANRAAFEREADLLAELNNEHIPKIFDRFSEGTRHYLVMEYVPGETLTKWLIKRGGRIDQAAALDVGKQILAGLSYLHSHQPPIAYRDLKPDNVMITPDNRVRLIDFGIARHFTRAKATVVGTPGYAAPEQYKGQVDLRTDIYAFGALMHHLLSGRDPQNEPPFSFPPLVDARPGTDLRLANLIDRCLRMNPDERPQTSTEVVAEIDSLAAVAPQPQSARNRAPARPRVIFCTHCGAKLPRRGKCVNCGSARYAS
jgi:serine/threonine protein kinase